MRDHRSIPSRVVALVVVAALGGSAAPARAAEDEPVALTPLAAVVERLGVETRAFDWGALWGISVLDLDTGELAEFQGDQWLKAASSLKMTWMAAAIRNAGVEAVEPYATPVMVWSVNESAGGVIQLAGGLDAVNRFTMGVGMDGTLVVEWTFGMDERSRWYPGAHPWLNYTTPRDLVTFWQLLDQRLLLDPQETETLLAWSRLSRSAGPNSGLLTRLPPDAADWVAYKMGYLPPGRSYEKDDEGNPIVIEGQRDVIIGSGIVDIPGGHSYAIAVGGFGGDLWPRKVDFVAYASCRIYQVISGEDIECDRSGDPERSRLDPDAPSGGIHDVRGSSEFISVRGWATDPDDPLGTIRVRFTVDGVWHGITRARSFHSWGADRTTVLDGHGFEVRLLTLLSPGDHEICGLAINDGAGPDTPVGCQTITIPE